MVEKVGVRVIDLHGACFLASLLDRSKWKGPLYRLGPIYPYLDPYSQISYYICITGPKVRVNPSVPQSDLDSSAEDETLETCFIMSTKYEDGHIRVPYKHDMRNGIIMRGAPLGSVRYLSIRSSMARHVTYQGLKAHGCRSRAPETHETVSQVWHLVEGG